ncbi:hypothetical protein BD410DRAFT_765770 [Rickenella mellea]|uniref:4Fe-4S ferredoxin-type domain-containing protein n=1 Tax=Rickenella mellea TaxID=50990 RepID=A0A4Y7QD15_9AGAM|nr:hypothetical protein BD410DRAFT_765770 [Rickenella mellea]
MPADRRTTSADVRHREQELKRSRGELACAECTRLKLRCNKKILCSSCLRRGCSSICPNGALTTGQGTRLVLADTEQLHRKLMEMSERIRQLEDALLLVTSRWPKPHPLLRDDLLSIKTGYDAGEAAKAAKAEDPHQDDLTGEVGTLTVSDDGSARFIGPTGASHFQSLLAVDTQYEEPMLGEQSPTSQVIERSQTSSYKSDCDSRYLLTAKESLPSYERAWTLCETYLEQGQWVARIVQRQQLIDELLIPIYKNKMASSTDGKVEGDVTSIDELALLLVVFATGALFDLTLPPDNDHAHYFYELACQLVSMDSVAGSPSLIAMQTITQMGMYIMLTGRAMSIEKSFTLFNFAYNFGAGLGLHRDPRRWNLKEDIVQRRRLTFWQLFLCCNWQCISTGRPLPHNLSFIDTQFPDVCDHIVDLDGSLVADSAHWKFRFAKEVLYEVNKVACSVAPVKYSQILEMNRKIRAFDFPHFLRIPDGGLQWGILGAYSVMQRIIAAIWPQWLLIHVNRSYFAKALMEYPDDPTKSPFSASLLTTYRSALSIVKLVKDQSGVCHNYFIRITTLWRYVFSSLVVIGALVVRAPKSSLAHAALIQLTLGVMFFENVTLQARRDKHELNILFRLRRKAFQAFTLQRSDQSSNGVVPVKLPEGESWIDDLSILTKNNFSKKPAPEMSILPTSPCSSGSPPTFSTGNSPTQSPTSSETTYMLPLTPNTDKSVPTVLSRQELAIFLAEASTISERPPASYPNASARPVPTQSKAPRMNATENEILMAYEESIAPLTNSDPDCSYATDAGGTDTPTVDFMMGEAWSAFVEDSSDSGIHAAPRLIEM